MPPGVSQIENTTRGASREGNVTALSLSLSLALSPSLCCTPTLASGAGMSSGSVLTAAAAQLPITHTRLVCDVPQPMSCTCNERLHDVHSLLPQPQPLPKATILCVALGKNSSKKRGSGPESHQQVLHQRITPGNFTRDALRTVGDNILSRRCWSSRRQWHNPQAVHGAAAATATAAACATAAATTSPRGTACIPLLAADSSSTCCSCTCSDTIPFTCGFSSR